MASCPNCSSTLDESGALMRCPSCKIFIPRATAQEDETAVPVELEQQTKAQVRLPAKFRQNHATHGLEVSWPWSRTAAWFLVFFTLFWDGFIGFVAWQGGLSPILIFLLPFMLIGVGLLYLTLALMLNHSTLKVERGAVTIRSGPLPLGNKEYPKEKLKQLYCQEYQAGNVGAKPIMRFKVMALLEGGKAEELVNDLEQLEEALYIEQEVERLLGIQDRAVQGEYQRS